MTNLYLVRHAHSIYSPDELGRPLSEKGLADAFEVTEILKTEDIDLVISSPYKRAIQTVQDIANLMKKEVEIYEGFKERILTTEPTEDFTHAITKVWEDENFAWEGGESNLVAQKRGIEAINQVLEQYKNQNVVIGTHGNIMVLIMKYFDRRYNFEFWKRLEMPDIFKLSLDGKSLVDVTRVWKNKQGSIRK